MTAPARSPAARLAGSIPALVTPMRDGAVDHAALERLVDWQIDSGSHALVPCGTTGESATLSFDEHYAVIDRTIAAAAGRVPVIAGCGSNDTATAVRHMAHAAKAGATAALVVAPYYNRPSAAGMIAHFRHLAERSDLPMVIYNVPGRTVTDLTPAIVAALLDLPSVVAIKDASGDIGRVTAHRLDAAAVRGEPDALAQLCGNDDQWLAHGAAGGTGCISVTANVAPGPCAALAGHIAAGEWDAARALQDRLYPLHKAMFADASPAPAKYALSRLHPWFAADARLPILPADAPARAAVDAALDTLRSEA